MTITILLRGLTIVAVVALSALLVDVGEPAEPGWWAAALPLALWVAGPAAAPYLLASRWTRRWFAIVMLLYLAVSSILSGLAYWDGFFRSRSSTASLVLVFVPLWQCLALALLLLACGAAALLVRRRSPGAR